MSTLVLPVESGVSKRSPECTRNIFRDFEYKNTRKTKLLIYLKGAAGNGHRGRGAKAPFWSSEPMMIVLCV